MEEVGGCLGREEGDMMACGAEEGGESGGSRSELGEWDEDRHNEQTPVISDTI